MNQEPADIVPTADPADGDTTLWPAVFEEVLREHTRFADAAAPIDPDTALTVLGVDSFAMLVLLANIEDRLDVAVPDEMVTVEVFATPRTLWNAVVDLKRQQGEARGDD